MAQGRTAIRTGRNLERSVEEIIQIANYKRIRPPKEFWSQRGSEQIYARQAPTGLDIYWNRRRVDFILYHPKKWPDCLVIQCKWQAVSGSVEQKYPFETLSILKDGLPCVVVLDGGGYSEGAEKWLRCQQGQRHLLHVFNLGEFQRFARRSL